MFITFMCHLFELTWLFPQAWWVVSLVVEFCDGFVTYSYDNCKQAYIIIKNILDMAGHLNYFYPCSCKGAFRVAVVNRSQVTFSLLQIMACIIVIFFKEIARIINIVNLYYFFILSYWSQFVSTVQNIWNMSKLISHS